MNDRSTGPPQQLVPGFGFTGYRSFRDELQLLAPLRKVNLLAGTNNAGKSNVLRFATDYLGVHGAAPPTGLDLPTGGGSDGEVAIAVYDSHPAFDAMIANAVKRANVAEHQIRKLFELPGLRLTDDFLLWFRIPLNRNGGPLRISVRQAAELANQFQNDGLLYEIAQRAGSFSTPGRPDANIQEILRILVGDVIQLPHVEFIDAFREIRSNENDEVASHSGINLIRALRKLQDPASHPDYEKDEQRFNEITEFVRALLDDPSVRLRVPHDLSTINISQGGRPPLPLHHYGTGLHQVVILAVAATVLENSLICIEEPEVHLHPLLQRKLIAYLTRNTSNQYLIATHSASMLDYENAAVFSVRLEEGASKVRLARLPHEVAEICGELGYRASDIIQANVVVWVEGPSDRVYLQHWLKICAPQLKEGFHFSIMFYGGRLLRHLSASDPEVDEFISLRRLNRNICIVIDRDTQSRRAKLLATKDRVQAELVATGPGFAWLTDGYTIENYVPVQLLANALQKIHPKMKHVVPGGRWSNPFPVGKGIDKVGIARAVCESWVEADFADDLRRHIRKLVKFIASANVE